jgi:hypothetical protein
MGMFDWYVPTPTIPCAVCGDTPREWQGKDGPCALVVWHQGQPSPVEHRVDAEVENLAGFALARLPPQFSIHALDSRDHTLIAEGVGIDGTWATTRLVRVVQGYRSRNGQVFVRRLWGTPNPRTPKAVSDR